MFLKYYEDLIFYQNRYDTICNYEINTSGDEIVLRDKHQVCRFCQERDVRNFSKIAHAIPESIGNKKLISKYECDSCNHFFGNGIEHDFGLWSQPIRTMSRIPGKKGVPKIEINHDRPLKVDYKEHLTVRSFSNPSRYLINRDEKTVKLDLQLLPHVPQDVYRAFIKMGLSVIPEIEVKNFNRLYKWLRFPDDNPDYFNQFPVIRTFCPGPFRNDRVNVSIHRIKSNVFDVPYCFMKISYANEMYQVFLPSEIDGGLNGVSLSFPKFPHIYEGNPAFGFSKTEFLDLSSKKKTEPRDFSITFSYDKIFPYKVDGII